MRFAGASPLSHKRVRDAIAAAEADLDGIGRLLIRESGTEPLIRVMAEGEDEALVAPRGRRAVRDDRRGHAPARQPPATDTAGASW